MRTEPPRSPLRHLPPLHSLRRRHLYRTVYELPCLERCSVGDEQPLSVTPVVARFLRQPRPMTKRLRLGSIED